MTKYDCASCEDHVCREGVDCYEMADQARRLYKEANESDTKILEAAAKVESAGYMRWPRALEVMRFARNANFTHLGIAFCTGLAAEARIFNQMLKGEFEVSSVCCKICGIPKSDIGLPRVRPKNENEAMCSPLVQAEALNQAETDLNIIIGLCVGHDALFSKHSAAPVTTLIAKDRVLGHNPAAAVYSRYWKNKIRELEGEER